MIKLLKGKIHHIRVDDTKLNYVGSIELPRTLMLLANIVEYEEVHVWNVTNGARYTTYAVPGGRCVVMGPSARLVQPGDVLVIGAFHYCLGVGDNPEPSIVLVDSDTNEPTI